MNFKELLNEYIEKLDCSSKELSEVSGISQPTISRYRNGERIPDYKSQQLDKLLIGITTIAKNKQINDINIENIKDDFLSTYGKNAVDANVLSQNLNKIITELNINISKMAIEIKFDASYISRISSRTKKTIKY